MSLAWMPSGMDPADKQAFADAYPTDPHRAAAMAWQSWAASLPIEPPVTSVSTGAQSISYEKGYSEYEAAMARSDWHLVRAKAVAINVGQHYRFGWVYDTDRFVETYDSPPLPQIGRAQIMTKNGLVGPDIP